MAHRKGEFGGRTQCFEKVYMEAVCSQYVGSDFGKLTAVVAAVVAHGSLDGVGIGEAFLHIVGQALGGHGHGVFVHTVGAHTHNAAQTARTEFKITIEAFIQLIGIIHHVADSLFGFFIILAIQPCFSVLFCRSVNVQIVDIIHSLVLSIR